MTSRATNVRANILSNEVPTVSLFSFFLHKARICDESKQRELFLFNRKQLELNSKPPLDPPPRIPSITPFPDDLESETDMSSWRLLFKKRKAWAENVRTQATALANCVRDTDSQIRTMHRAVAVAFANLEAHSVGLGESLVRLREWAEGIMAERERALARWEPAVKQLPHIPVHDAFKMYGRDANDAVPPRRPNLLSDFFDLKEVHTAAATSEILVQRFEKAVVDLGTDIENVCSRTDQLKTAIQQSAAGPPALNVEHQLSGLLEELDVLTAKIRTDNDYARSLQGPKSASAASKRAYASTTEYLPGLTAVAIDLGKLLTAVCEQKKFTSTTCHEQLQNIAVIQSISAPINPLINKLDVTYVDEDTNFQLLSFVIQLPSSYGSLLVECVRRREWSEKFQGNSQRLAEDLALMKEDEEKRRRKWLRSTAGLLPFNLGDGSSQTVRAELNIRGDPSGGLPKITRQDVEAYVATLKAVGGMDATVQELTHALQEVDKPSRRINKRLKAFKMGSIHEATLMNSSSILNLPAAEDEVRTLRADKEQLSERIKGYESRIRKLEDLLHRGRAVTNGPYQAAAGPPIGRPSAPGMVPQSFPPTATTQYPDHQPPPPPSGGKPTVPHRRSSSEAQNSFEALKARVAELTAELAAEKERAARLQKEASQNNESEKKAMNARITQTEETKKDLIANLEATVQQNITERKSLTSEIEELKERLEVADEELYRAEEERVKPLESELGAVKSLLKTQHDEAIQQQKDLSGKLEAAEQCAADELAKLRAELETQIGRADEASRRAAQAEAELSTCRQDKASLAKALSDAETALEADRDERSKSQASLMGAMRQAHGHLSSDHPPEDPNLLMGQVEALVAGAVAKNKELGSSLEAEKANYASLCEEKDFLQNRFDSRTLRAKDLTQRLYTHNARSIQLLESLGYKIVRGEDSMQIVKVPRTNNPAESTVLIKSAGTPGMPGDAQPQTQSQPQPQPTTQTQTPAQTQTQTQTQTQKSSPLAAQDPPPAAADDVNLLYWMESPDSDTESEKYSRYLKTIVAFDLDAFSETVINRVRKAEHDARQLVKQGRAYREKYYRARDEASEKIAFKSFKHGDLALFLPTKNQVTRPWAAFNIGAPHFFLREQDSHKLASRDWLLARITKVEERQVDLSRSTASVNLPHGAERSSITSSDGGASLDDENPFELSDGLRWYLLDAVEEKTGAPTTPGLSSSTVASANVDAKGSLKSRKPITGAKKKLSEITTEHSRRSSSSASGNRNSVSLSADAVKAIMMDGDDSTAPTPPINVSAPTPRTPVEKIVAGVRSRASSIRSRTPAPEAQR